MAISTARRRGRAIPAISIAPGPDLPAEPLPIGLPDVDITSCPICSRPIAVGSARCPGCGTHLLLGVPVRRAGTFVVLGLVIGLLAGGGSAAIVLGRSAASGPPAQGAGVIPAGGTSAVPVVSPAPSVATPRPTTGVPSQAAAALGQVLVVNDRLGSRASELRAELAAKPFDTFAVATTLRSLTADAVVGSGMTGRIGTWPAAIDVSTRLAAYYRLVGSSAAAALAASLGDVAAYRSGASAMLKVLGGLGPLDAATETLATQAGLDLPAASSVGP